MGKFLADGSSSTEQSNVYVLEAAHASSIRFTSLMNLYRERRKVI